MMRRRTYVEAKSIDGKYQIAIKSGGSTYISSNHGKTWSLDTTLPTTGHSSFFTVISGNGKHQLILLRNNATTVDTLYRSLDYGKTWSAFSNPLGIEKNVVGLALSFDGKYQIISNSSRQSNFFISSDYGQIWNVNDDFLNTAIGRCALSSDGRYQAVVINGSSYYAISSDYGQTWDVKLVSSGNITDVSISSDGQYMLFGLTSGVAISSNYGQSTIKVLSPLNSQEIRRVKVSGTGKYQLAISRWAQPIISSDYGQNWTTITGVSGEAWESGISTDGRYQAIAMLNSHIYTSSDYGLTWQISTDMGTNNSTIAINR